MMIMFINIFVRTARMGDGKMGVCMREWNSMTAVVLMATPCTNSLGDGNGGHNEGGEGRIVEREMLRGER